MATKNRCPQRGAALLMAMVILTLVATLAAGMVWQQSTAIAIETAERARAQSTWILNGAMDWSRIILREDGRKIGDPDHLGEPWATPLAEAKLTTFLAADKNNTDDNDVEAFLSGSIEDAQSRYDLRRLVGKVTKDNRLVAELIPAEQKALGLLFGHIGLPVELADSMATNLLRAWDDTTPTTASSDAPLAPQTVAQLRWLGVDEASINKMLPYVTILTKDGGTPINLNTASREVIAAVLDIDLGSADRLVQRRANNPFKSIAEAQTALSLPTVTIKDAQADIKSQHFEVRGRLRLGDHVQEEVSLMRRFSIETSPAWRELNVSPVWRTRSQTLRTN